MIGFRPTPKRTSFMVPDDRDDTLPSRGEYLGVETLNPKPLNPKP